MHIPWLISVTIFFDTTFRMHILNSSYKHLFLYGYATALMTYAFYLKKTGALSTLIGVTLILILNIFYKLFILFNLWGISRPPTFVIEITYILFISSVIISASIQIRHQNREHQKSLEQGLQRLRFRLRV